ncbi:zinc finger protein 852-like, partial [Mercenaria mercenaria]|uniref:zinc finger protein 852-like n=1 Tax=Mercenaria mercenaria TaxID=6596 RepID=UPI00234EAB05
MIPAIYHGQVSQHQYQPINGVSTDYVSNQSQLETENSFRQPLHFPGFQPFNITIANNNFYHQPTIASGFPSTASSEIRTTETNAGHNSESFHAQQGDTTTAVMSALHQTTPTNEINIVPNKTVDMFTSYQQTSPQSHHTQIPSPQQQQTNPSPLGELRLPTIKTSANVAANVMSEESDLGYCSFSDISALQEISDTIDYSHGSDDIFDDVKSNFSDLIDDVLDSIDNNDLIKTESVLQESDMVTNITESKVLEPIQEVFVHTAKQSAPVSPDNYFEQVKIPNAHTLPACVPYFIAPTAYLNTNTGSFHIDCYCHVCDKYFQTKSSLRVHMRQHRGERPHHCPYCQKSFTQKSTLRTHVRTHTGERPYTCNFCARAFSDYSTFRKHVRVHTGEKPYTCDVCKKSFTQSGNMIRHREVHFKKSHKKRECTLLRNKTSI